MFQPTTNNNDNELVDGSGFVSSSSLHHLFGLYGTEPERVAMCSLRALWFITCDSNDIILSRRFPTVERKVQRYYRYDALLLLLLLCLTIDIGILTLTLTLALWS
jgi:hypothetical protein